MDFEAETVVGLPLDSVWAAVRDLATYPHWFAIVRHVDVLADDAWRVELVGGVGLIRMSKRLRMVRTVDDVSAGNVRFERDEQDGRDHNPWTLDAHLTGNGNGDGDAQATRLRMQLHYGGIPSFPGGDLVLRNEARHAGRRLQELLRPPRPCG